jgi:hypothetical protein
LRHEPQKERGEDYAYPNDFSETRLRGASPSFRTCRAEIWGSARRKYMKRIGTLIVMTTLACSAEHGDFLDESGETSVSRESSTGTNPIIDTDFMGELPALPAGVSYTDLGTSSAQFFLARSDRTLEVRSDSLGLLQTISEVGEHVDWVQTGENWDLIASNNSAQQIRRKASSGSSILMGNFPAGVTSVEALVGHQLNANEIRIYIKAGAWPNQYVQTGTHYIPRTPARITWDPSRAGLGPYEHDLTIAPGPGALPQPPRIYRVVNYTTSRFWWYSVYTPPTLPTQGGEDGLPPYTDHAYLHPEGEYDRFAPYGFDYRAQNDYFYGIDGFHNHITGRTAWVMAKMHRSRLKP